MPYAILHRIYLESRRYIHTWKTPEEEGKKHRDFKSWHQPRHLGGEFCAEESCMPATLCPALVHCRCMDLALPCPPCPHTVVYLCTNWYVRYVRVQLLIEMRFGNLDAMCCRIIGFIAAAGLDRSLRTLDVALFLKQILEQLPFFFS